VPGEELSLLVVAGLFLILIIPGGEKISF